MAVLVYVDDILIVGNDDLAITQFKEVLQSAFKLRDLGPAKYFWALRFLETRLGFL